MLPGIDICITGRDNRREVMKGGYHEEGSEPRLIGRRRAGPRKANPRGPRIAAGGPRGQGGQLYRRKASHVLVGVAAFKPP